MYARENSEEYWREYWKKAREQSEGRWGSILSTLAPQLSDAVEAEGRRHFPCPVHGGKDGLRAFKDVTQTGGCVCNTCGIFHDGFATLKWANGWDNKTVVEEVTTYLNGGQAHAKPNIHVFPPRVAAPPKVDNESLRNSLNRVWNHSLPITDRSAEPARLYLARRGLSTPPPRALRFHPSLAYHNGKEVIGRYPAIIAVVAGANGQAVTIHRTYLTEDGQKAPVESQKKLMSYPDDRKALGGAIRLAKAGRVLAVAEGIETALAVIEGSGIPAWPTVNALLLENFVPPRGVEQLIVFADKDLPTKQHPKGHGQEAARRLVMRAWAMGIKATAIMPRGEIPEGTKSLDWLDILKRDGPKGFPSLESVRRSMLRAA